MAQIVRQFAILLAGLLLAGLMAAHSQPRPDLQSVIDEMSAAGADGDKDRVLALATEVRALALAEHGPEADYALTWTDYVATLLEERGDYDEALPLRLEIAEQRRAAAPAWNLKVIDAEDNLGRLYEFLGRYGEAEALLSSVVQRRLAGDPNRWRSFQNLGTVMASTGRHEAAAEFYSTALAAADALPDPISTVERVTLLTSLGGAHARRKDFAAAEPILLSANKSALAVLGPDSRYTAFTANWLGTLYKWWGRTDEAQAAYAAATESFIASLGRVHPETYVNANDHAELLVAAGDLAAADKLLIGNLAIADASIGAEHPEKAVTLALYADLLARQTGDREVALTFLKSAVNILQATRAGLSAGTPGAPDGAFVSKHAHIYETLQEWLISLGRFAEAEQVGRMLKDLEYRDFIGRRTGTDDPRLTRMALTDRAEAWQAQLADWAERPNRIALELAALEARQREGVVLTALEMQQLADLQARYEEAYAAYKQNINAWLAEVRALADETIQEEARALDAKFHDDLQQEIAAIGDTVAALQIVAFEDGVHIFLITPTAFRHVETATRREDLFRTIFRTRQFLSDVSPRAVTELQRLHAMLIAPVLPDLEDAGIDTLMLNLQGPIRYVPFAALNDGERYLAEDYKLALFTPAARTRFEASGELSRATGFGVTAEHSPFEALPGVGLELSALLGGEAPATGILDGASYLDAAFTRASFEAALTERRPILHIASHFQMLPGNDSSSFLLLGDGTRLSLADINRSPALRFGGVELITLSACSTALGSDGTGAEVEGFGVLAQAKGAEAVLATLWNVNDAATSRFMTRFYQGLRGDGTSKAGAVQAAQQGLIADPATAHPFYWAPFILMGNWK